jgi:hypothetical protein
MKITIVIKALAWSASRPKIYKVTINMRKALHTSYQQVKFHIFLLNHYEKCVIIIGRSSGRSPDDILAKRGSWRLCRHDVVAKRPSWDLILNAAHIMPFK